MKKYIHSMEFAPTADCILTDSPDETKRGYSLYAEIEAENLPAILSYLQQVYSFKIRGENIGISAYAFVDTIRGLTDDESTMREAFRLMRYSRNGKTELNYKLFQSEDSIVGKYIVITFKETEKEIRTFLSVSEIRPLLSKEVFSIFKCENCDAVLSRLYESQMSVGSEFVISKTEYIAFPSNVTAWIRSCIRIIEDETGMRGVEVFTCCGVQT